MTLRRPHVDLPADLHDRPGDPHPASEGVDVFVAQGERFPSA
jgi:hypothetical protein